jgi:hypothetical protein
MRILFSGVIAAGLLSSHLAAAQCARPIERTAFSVEELKSELMVTAITCKASAQYNAFMGRFKGDIAAREKELTGYFSRAYGRASQKQHDDYITNLANAQAQASLKSGGGFCDERLTMFDEVMALQGPQDLADYARGKDLAVPAVLSTCSGTETTKPVIREAMARRTVSHKK